MAEYIKQKPQNDTSPDSYFVNDDNLTRRPEIRVTQSNLGSNSGMFLIIAAVAVALAAYFFYANSSSPTSVTQTNITVPAPAAATPDSGTAPVLTIPNAGTAPVAPKVAPAIPDATKPAQ